MSTYSLNAESVLLNLTNSLMTVYDKSYPELHFELGSMSQRLVRPSKRVVNSSVEYLMSAGKADSSRARSALDADFDAPRRSEDAKLTIKLNQFDSTNNDFRRVDTISTLQWADIRKAGRDPEFAVNLVDRVVSQATNSATSTMSKLINTEADARIGTQNGAAKNSDSDNYSAASTYTSSSTTAKIVIDGGSIGLYSTNNYIEIWVSGAMVADGLRVGHVNTVDYSIDVSITSESTVADLDNLADNAVIYRAGEKGEGFVGGFGEIFKQTIASDDSWFGVNRSEEANRHFLPIRLNTTGATHSFSEDDLDNMAHAIGYKFLDHANDGGVPKVFHAGSDIARQVRRDIGNEALTQQAPKNMGEYTFGENAVFYMHPTLGRVAIVGDIAAPNDRAALINVPDWEMQYAYSGDIEYLSDGPGNWERKPGTNTSGGGSTYYRREGFYTVTPYCRAVNHQCVVHNVTGKGVSVA